MTNWKHLSIDEIKADSNAALAIGPFGSRMKADCYTSFGIPVIRGNNISGTKELTGEFVYVSEEKAQELTSSHVYDGDLVFPHRGLIGEVGIVTGATAHYVISSSLMKLTCNREIIDPLFLFYFFRSSTGRHELLKNASQVGTPGIATPLSSLRAIQVPIPPLSEQRAIAHILGTLDDKIELNRRMNETLEAPARAIFKSWFVDFDPVRAKMEGRQPVGMDAETAALFPAEFEDSALGQIPKGWKVVALPEAIEVNPRRTLSKGQVAPYLDMANMPTRGHRPDVWIDRAMGSGTKFMNGDTLLARITPCLENGKTAFVDFLEDAQVGWGSTEYIVFRPKPPLPVEFGYYLARSEDLRTHAIQNMTGSSGRQRVPAECFDSYLIAVPRDEVAEHFGLLVRSLMKAITQRDEESRTLAALRDTLLPKLLSGEVRVKEAEQQMDIG